MNTSPARIASCLARRLAGPAAAALAGVAAMAAQAQSQDEAAYAPDASVVQQVESIAKTGVSAATASAIPGVRVDVKVGKLDPRLHLAPCQHIEPYLPPGMPVWGTTRVGLRCTQGSKLWNVSLPVTVSVFAKATVLKSNLPAGTVLDASQLMTAEVDLAAAPGAAVTDASEAIGRTLGHTLMAGATLRQTDLKPRQFFAAGETVRVIAVGPGWNVETEGQAINAGVEGQVARIRTDGGRILNARPSGDRAVELTL